MELTGRSICAAVFLSLLSASHSALRALWLTYSKAGTLVNNGVTRDGALLGEITLGRPCGEVVVRHVCVLQRISLALERVFVVKTSIM